MATYRQIRNGETVEVSQFPLRIACCDCGLVHVVKIRKTKRGYRLTLTRDNRATGQLRRHRKHVVTKSA